MAIVTVSRTLGSWGDTIAERLAERLGARCVDRGMMVAEVYRYGFSTSDAFVPEMEERKPTFLQRFDEERQRYTVLLRAILYDLAAQEDLVIIGLGAQYLLAHVRHAIRTLTVAPLNVRIERIMETEGLDRSVAATAVRQSDRDRAGYHQYLHQVDWKSPELYDVVINTDRMDVDSAVDLLLQMTSQPEFAPSADSTQLVADLALASRIEANLVTSQRVAIDALEVSAKRGRVSLSGLVFTEEEREVAESIVRQTAGVTDVQSDIRLKPLPAPFP